MTKCKGGCQMRAGGKTCKKCGCDMEDEEYEKGKKEMRSGGMACMKCGGKMHKSGGTVSSCMKCGGGKYTFGGKVNWSKKKVTSNSSEKYAFGGIVNDPPIAKGLSKGISKEMINKLKSKTKSSSKQKPLPPIDLTQTVFEEYEKREKLNDPYNPDGKPIITTPAAKQPFNHTLGYNILEGIDPTGITSYPDVYEAWTDGELNWSDITEPLGALPGLGKFFKLGKLGKVFKGAPPKSTVENIYNTVDFLGNIIDTSSDIYQDNVVNKANGGMIKRADGSYSQRGLWDNIRANAGSGKKPTKQMLEQEKKINQKMAVGGTVDTGCPDGMVKDPITGDCVYPYITSNPNDPRIKSYSDSTALYNNYVKNFNTIKSGGKYHSTVETTKPAEYSTSGTWKDTNPNNEIVYKKVGDFGYNVIGEKGYPDLTFMSNRKIQPIATETFTRKESQYPSVKSFDEYAKRMRLRANASFSEKPNEAKWVGYELQKYKAPVQPVVYKKPDVRVPVIPVEEVEKMMEKMQKEREQNDRYAAYEKWRAENPWPEPEPQINDEMEISLYKPIETTKKSIEIIPSNDVIPIINTGIKYQEESNQGAYPTMSEEGQGMTNKKGKRKHSFGGAIDGMKKYFYGGETDNTKMTDDTEIQLGRGAFNISEPAYDANEIMKRVFNNATSLKESEQPITRTTGYKQEVEKNTVVKDDKSLPNWGRAKKEQQKLNELIRKDILLGKQVMPLLVEDDIIGEKTLGAMRAYEASGQYKRPELFKDKWLAEYKKQWQEMQKSKSSAANQETKTETQTESINPNPTLNPSFNFFSPDWGKLSSNTKENIKPKGKGWPKEQLLKEGGVEIDSKELIPKDFDTYQPIKGISKSTKGVRATSRDGSDAYFDAAEKDQTYEKDGKKVNTSLGYIAELLSKSKKAIIIPKGQDPYGRDLNDIYLQDENNPNQYHALDSSGVVKGEAIYGQWLTGEEGKMTDRQKMITGQSQEQGGFKYELSPWLFRETKDYNKKPSNQNNKTEYTKPAEGKSGVTVLRKYDASGPSYTKIKIVVKDNATNKTHTVIIPQMFDKAKGKYHTIEIAGKKHKIFLDPNLK